MKELNRPLRSLRAVPFPHQILRDVVELFDGVAAFVLHLKGEAAKAADAGDGRRQEGEGLHIGKLHQRSAETVDDGGGGILRALALIDVGQVQEDHALVGAAAGEAEAHDAEGADDVLFLGDQGLDLAHGLRGVFHRGPLRRLHCNHEPALILVGNEAGGHHLVDNVGGTQPGKENDQDQVAKLDRLLGAVDVVGGAAMDHMLHAAEEDVLLPCLRPQQQSRQRWGEGQ